MSWLKWRHKFSSGPDEWEWEELNCEDDLECFVENLKERYSGASEHYRGVETVWETPPLSVLETKLNAARRMAIGWRCRVNELEVQIENMKSGIYPWVKR